MIGKYVVVILGRPEFKPEDFGLMVINGRSRSVVGSGLSALSKRLVGDYNRNIHYPVLDKVKKRKEHGWYAKKLEKFLEFAEEYYGFAKFKITFSHMDKPLGHGTHVTSDYMTGSESNSIGFIKLGSSVSDQQQS